MAPEQLQGKEADARNDISSLGLTLHEMATGKNVLPGQTPRMDGPRMDGLPERFVHILELCLEPVAENRWQSASGVKAELEWAA